MHTMHSYYSPRFALPSNYMIPYWNAEPVYTVVPCNSFRRTKARLLWCLAAMYAMHLSHYPHFSPPRESVLCFLSRVLTQSTSPLRAFDKLIAALRTALMLYCGFTARLRLVALGGTVPYVLQGLGRRVVRVSGSACLGTHRAHAPALGGLAIDGAPSCVSYECDSERSDDGTRARTLRSSKSVPRNAKALVCARSEGCQWGARVRTRRTDATTSAKMARRAREGQQVRSFQVGPIDFGYRGGTNTRPDLLEFAPADTAASIPRRERGRARTTLDGEGNCVCVGTLRARCAQDARSPPGDVTHSIARSSVKGWAGALFKDAARLGVQVPSSGTEVCV
ncbi:hypothetical protein FB451DRAFT_1516938 [Mycena latifolia]|nr:hypothetical protein FB451DRAFT_1516938 [Mycena latifolia]